MNKCMICTTLVGLEGSSTEIKLQTNLTEQLPENVVGFPSWILFLKCLKNKLRLDFKTKWAWGQQLIQKLKLGQGCQQTWNLYLRHNIEKLQLM